MISRLYLENRNKHLSFNSSPILKHENLEYETVKMYKGYEKTYHGNVRRRIYKSQLLLPNMKMSDIEILKDGEGVIIEVYCHEQDTQEGKEALIKMFDSEITRVNGMIEDFIDGNTISGTLIKDL